MNTNEPASAQLLELVQKNQLRSAQTVTFYSMLSTEQDFVLSSIRAVDGNYPVKGELWISHQQQQPAFVAEHIPESGTIWVEPRVLLMLNLHVGDMVTVGDMQLQISAVIDLEPDIIGEGFNFAPRALINQVDLQSTHVLMAGSRASYRLLLAGSPAAVQNFAAEVTPLLKEYQRLKFANQDGALTSRTVQQSEKYLHLAVIINIILAAVVVCVVAQHYGHKHMYTAAVIRCFGATNRQLIIVYMVSQLLMSLIVALLGSGLGYILQRVIGIWLAQLLQVQLPLPGYQPVLLGVTVTVLLMLGLSIPTLYAITKSSPMSVLRGGQNRANLQNIMWITYTVLAVGLFSIIYWQIPDIKLVMAMLYCCVIVLALAIACQTAMRNFLPWCSARLRGVWHLGLNNILFNLEQNIVQIVAFGLVICVGLLLYIVRVDLLKSWIGQLPENTPNYFVINIDTVDVAALRDDVAKHGIIASEFYPIVRGNLVAINDEPVKTEANSNVGRDGINRPLNLTWMQNVPTDNQILQGAWFSTQENGNHVLSIERSFAERLKVTLGDSLTFKIGIDVITAQITSIRSLRWESFTPNFYVIYPPGLIDDFDATYMVSLFVKPEQESVILNLVRNYPSINVVSTNAILTQAEIILNLVKLVVLYIWAFTMAISLLLLIAIVLVNMPIRYLQNNLMRVFGASKRQLQAILSVEFLTIGAAAGLLGAVVALGMSWYVTNYIAGLDFVLQWWMLLLGLVVGSIMMWISGIVSAGRALQTAPIMLLRDLR